MSTESSQSRDDRPNRTLFVSAVAKSLRILRTFDETNTALSLKELAQQTGLDKSAVQRLANTLYLEGMLERGPDNKKYRPSHTWLELTNAYYWSNPLIAAAMPKLIDLSQMLGETINLVEMSGDHVIYLYRLPCKRTQYSATLPGRRIPALTASSGRAMLSTWPEDACAHAIETWPLVPYTPRTTVERSEISAEIQRARDTGYVITQQEVILSEMAIATPIPAAKGCSTAAVQCSVSAHSWTKEKLIEKVLPHLLDTANGITSPAD